MKARLRAALPATWALVQFLWLNRKMEMAIGGVIVGSLEEIARILSGHA